MSELAALGCNQLTTCSLGLIPLPGADEDEVDCPAIHFWVVNGVECKVCGF